MMLCYDCERDPCICREIFPFAREYAPDGKVYDHNGGLLIDMAYERSLAADPLSLYAQNDLCPWCDGTGGEAMQPCRRCNGNGTIEAGR